MRIAFNQFDKDGSGSIATEELRDVFQAVGYPISNADLQEMIERADEDGRSLTPFAYGILATHHNIFDTLRVLQKYVKS